MNESVEPQDFRPNHSKDVPQHEERIIHIGAGYPPPSPAELEACEGVVVHLRMRLDELLERGAEPFWMQDIRIAQRAIEAQRRAIAHSQPADLQ